MAAAERHPAGAVVSLAELEGPEPHGVLARLRAVEPVSWLPAMDGWLVTRRDLALEVMRDPVTYTVDDPRFTTAQVVGPSMLSLDGSEHARHRRPFTAPFKSGEVRRELAPVVRAHAERLAAELVPQGRTELRRGYAGPLAAGVVGGLLGLDDDAVDDVLAWYDAIVAAVQDLSAGRPVGEQAERAMTALADALAPVIRSDGRGSLLAAASAGATGLDEREVVANAAVLLFGGIETTEGMIANAALHLLSDPALLARVRADRGLLPAVVEESLRLEPAAAAVDRYATADAALGGAAIRAGELVRVSVTAVNRDPAAFPDPDEFRLGRDNARSHLAFASGPHVCVAMHLARLEAHVALEVLLDRLPGLRLPPAGPREIHGLVFRKPPRLDVRWDAVAQAA